MTLFLIFNLPFLSHLKPLVQIFSLLLFVSESCPRNAWTALSSVYSSLSSGIKTDFNQSINLLPCHWLQFLALRTASKLWLPSLHVLELSPKQVISVSNLKVSPSGQIGKMMYLRVLTFLLQFPSFFCFVMLLFSFLSRGFMSMCLLYAYVTPFPLSVFLSDSHKYPPTAL